MKLTSCLLELAEKRGLNLQKGAVDSVDILVQKEYFDTLYDIAAIALGYPKIPLQTSFLCCTSHLFSLQNHFCQFRRSIISLSQGTLLLDILQNDENI
jgi:hypothetical protein